MPIATYGAWEHDVLMVTKVPTRHRTFGTRRWLPRGRLARHSRGPLLGGVLLRLRVRCRAQTLDDDLARGVDPRQSDALSLRTGQLRSRKTRTRICRSLMAAQALAGREPPPAPGLPPLVCLHAVVACSELIATLADRIDEGRNLDARGLAITMQLLRDGRGPLYDEDAPVSLDNALRLAIAALGEPSEWPGSPAS